MSLNGKIAQLRIEVPFRYKTHAGEIHDGKLTAQLSAEAIEAIKQAFIAEGWQEPRAKAVNLTFDNGKPEQLMTGPEWLERSLAELEKSGLPQNSFGIKAVRDALRRAAGVDDE